MPPTPRTAIAAAIGVCVLLTFWFNMGRLNDTELGSKLASVSLPSLPSIGHVVSTAPDSHLAPPVALYFDQVFAEKPKPYDYPALALQCDRTSWVGKENVYMKCSNMFAGITSIMSEVKTCFKMAAEAGTGLILPVISLRDSNNLKEFNVGHDDQSFAYDQWFDVDHLKQGLSRACPQMKVLHPDALNQDQADKITIVNDWSIDIYKAPKYHEFTSHFWTGNPFSQFFNTEFAKLRKEASPAEGISIVKVKTIFLLFRITDDPTGGDLAIWNDLGMLVRFLEKPRQIVHNLLDQTQGRPFYGVHFRVENDTVWQSLTDQLHADLDALDKAYEIYGDKSKQKPIVYVACGDEKQMTAFEEGGKERGWEVTHKWNIARQIGNGETVKMIDELAFDFQGAVDMGMMVYSHFFIGISGSAFSNTVAHARDVTGRYRGSSLREKFDDEGSRNYLVHDGQASSYPCCL